MEYSSALAQQRREKKKEENLNELEIALLCYYIILLFLFRIFVTRLDKHHPTDLTLHEM